jgi:hypothetical protein
MIYFFSEGRGDGFGGVMDSSENEERPNQVITIRVTASEKAALKALAKKGSLTMSDVIRTALKTERHNTEKMLSKAKRIQKPNPQTLIQLGRIGGLLKALHVALLRTQNNGSRLDVQQIFKAQKVISDEVKKIRAEVNQDKPC